MIYTDTSKPPNCHFSGSWLLTVGGGAHDAPYNLPDKRELADIMAIRIPFVKNN